MLPLTKKTNFVLTLSAIFLIITSINSTGFHHIDEHFQILEFAALKLGLTSPSELPWEYREQMRSAFQPAIAVLFYKLSSWLGEPDPFLVTTLLRLFSAFISFIGMLGLYHATKKRFTTPKLQNWFLWLSFLSWFLFYNHVRFSSENWSGTFFVIGYSYFLIKKDEAPVSTLFWTGVFLGFAFISRYQTAFLTLGFFAWLLFQSKIHRRQCLAFPAGFMAIFSLGIIIDHWFYERWTLASLNYFSQNILHDKVSHFGLFPWWFYLKKVFEEAIPPFSLIIPPSFLLYFYWNRRDLLTWSLIPFLAIHFIIGHKETRFLYPVVGFIPLMIASFFLWLETRGVSPNNTFPKYFMRLYFIANALFTLFVLFNSANGYVDLYKFIYTNYPKPVTLYHPQLNPYHNVYDFHFYSRPKLTLISTDNLNRVAKENKHTQLVAVSIVDESFKKTSRHRLVYSTYPAWLYPYGARGWIGLRKAFFIYELEG